jgi:RsiW-degrading membrane proteinase PrsW (M82 family)
MASILIHGVWGGLQTPIAGLVETYIVAIVIIGLMVVHWSSTVAPHQESIDSRRRCGGCD